MYQRLHAVVIVRQNQREPSESDLNGALFQGRHVAEIATKPATRVPVAAKH